MLRALAMISLFLSGCGSIPGLESYDTDRPYAALQRDNSCTAVAAQRAQDAAYNDIDRDTQKLIYASSYADCVKGREKNHH